jgi:hypothetical protein
MLFIRCCCKSFMGTKLNHHNRLLRLFLSYFKMRKMRVGCQKLCSWLMTELRCRLNLHFRWLQSLHSLSTLVPLDGSCEDLIAYVRVLVSRPLMNTWWILATILLSGALRFFWAYENPRKEAIHSFFLKMCIWIAWILDTHWSLPSWTT